MKGTGRKDWGEGWEEEEEEEDRCRCGRKE